MTRHVVLLRLNLAGTYHAIRREVVVDRDLTLAELRPILQSVFDRPACRHHLFTDSTHATRWSRERRRWGNRWTMIDFRDPTVIDEETARIGQVLVNGRPLYYAHTCDASWVVEIEAGPDDVVAASELSVRIVGGERRSPFRCSRGPYEHDAMVGALEDPGHPDNEALRACIASTVGPWSRFDAEAFDLDAAQRALQSISTKDRSSTWAAGPLGMLVDRLPEPARAGLRAHLAAAGLGLPVVVTAEETARMTREFQWLIVRASAGGVPHVAGAIDTADVRAGVDALGCDEDRIRRLFAAARQLRLVYFRHGRLVAKKSVRAAAEKPTELWMTLADAVSSFTGQGADSVARDLLLLAIADGTLDDPRIGIRRSAQAYALASGSSRDFPHSSWREFDHHDPDCDQRCNCPTVNGATWHDIVTKSIRDAAASAANDGAVTVAAGEDYYDLLQAGVLPEWVETGTPRTGIITTRAPGDNATDSDRAASKMLSAVASTVDVLLLFGLSRSEDGTWSVPPTLREFCRAALQSRSGSTQF